MGKNAGRDAFATGFLGTFGAILAIVLVFIVLPIFLMIVLCAGGMWFVSHTSEQMEQVRREVRQQVEEKAARDARAEGAQPKAPGGFIAEPAPARGVAPPADAFPAAEEQREPKLQPDSLPKGRN